MVLSWLCPSASMSNSVRSSAGGSTWKGSSAGSPGLSSTVLLLLAKQESRLLGVSVLELLAEDSPLALLGDTNHQGSSRCRLAAGRGRGRNSSVLGLSSVGSCCAFHRLGVGGKTRLGSGRRGTSLRSLLGLGVFNTPIQNRQCKRRGKNMLAVTAKWFLQILVYCIYSGKTYSKQKVFIQNLQTLYLQDYGNLKMLEPKPLPHYSVSYSCKDSLHKQFSWAGHLNKCISNK